MQASYHDPTKIKKIFIVDDKETNLAVARDALHNDYLVLCMTSAARMFKVMEKITPDLILLDIQMPDMTGLQALELIRNSENEAHRDLKVVFLTSYGTDENVLSAHRNKAHGFIIKPFDPASLRQKIDQLVSTN